MMAKEPSVTEGSFLDSYPNQTRLVPFRIATEVQ